VVRNAYLMELPLHRVRHRAVTNGELLERVGLVTLGLTALALAAFTIGRVT